MSEVGIFGMAYYVVKDVLMADEDSRQLKSYALGDSCIYKFMKEYSRPMAMGIHRNMDNVKLHFLDPVEYIISNTKVEWGMVAYAERHDHVFGAVFRYLHPSRQGLEYVCGLMLDHSKIRMIYSPVEDRGKTVIFDVPFLKEGIDKSMDMHASDKLVQGVFDDYPGIYGLSADLVELVHDVLTGEDLVYNPPDIKI